MKTKIRSGKKALELAKEIILQGGVVAFPTETVYGLGANAYDGSAVERIFQAKGRPQDNPLIVHIGNIADLYCIADKVSEAAQILAEKFMPGPITLVLKKKDIIPSVVTAGLGTVGVRMPSHKIAHEFIKSCGVPIAAPSANISSHISPTSAGHVYNDLKGRIPLIIDGGSSDVGIESTVVDMSSEDICILRPGAVTRGMIEAALNRQIKEKYSTDKAPAAPGMKYRHYAPVKPVRIYGDTESIIEEYNNLVAEGKRPVIITGGKGECYKGMASIDVGSSTAEAAKNIYAALREGEEKYDFILSENFEDDSIGHSIMNRLYKAAEKK